MQQVQDVAYLGFLMRQARSDQDHSFEMSQQASQAPSDVEGGGGAAEGEEIGLTTGQAARQRPWCGPAVNLSLALLMGLGMGIALAWTVSSPGHSSSPAQEELLTAPLNFLVVGDWGREGQYNQSVVADAMGIVGEQLNIDFVVSTGDNFYERGLRSLDDPLFERSFSSVYTARSLQTLWYAVLGNHDYVQQPAVQCDPALKLRDPRWHCQRSYSIRRSVCPLPAGECTASAELFFVDTSPFVTAYWGFLNFTGLTSQEEETAQAIDDLTAALQRSNATWKLVIGHHPIRSMGTHGDTAELIQHLLPVLEEYHVDAYINGHDHALELIQRSESSVPLVTSGAGSKCYRPHKDALPEHGLVFDHNGQGFVAVSIAPAWLQLEFLDLFGAKLHSLHLAK